ncbi:flagellar biosynthesis protein FlhF [Paenibacillus sp. P96]|uniref:Flagellar biosynthesis protein FlhF n=1 Tax=Paenibacillus zeirhizosphaerae TaxID=2987519 RepID=A0ABT9FS69_9BACL|nr:flagellar biosynthesis protein FlhF [Paenibacillus sp. P96]MDP4097525.1 flagellar biosynthesis protein FlhF [Paenibacillus sp. P96]
MRVKRYVVDTMPEAMQQIRGELGTDAVILSTKEMKVGGFLGLFSKKKIEVIAAVEKETDASARTTSGSPVNSSQKQPHVPQAVAARVTAPGAYKRTAAMLSKDSEGDGKRRQTAAEPPRQQAESQGSSGPQSFPHEAVLPVSDLTAAALADERFAVKDGDASDSVSQDALLEEIREMKAMMNRISRYTQVSPALPEQAQTLRERLLEQDVEQALANEWLERVLQRQQDSGVSIEEFSFKKALSEEIQQFLSHRFGGGISSGTKIVYIAGPTGVGKTTTIAKLAAEQLFKYQRKVGFITSDTYRISAVEQLRTYATILNVPLEVVQSPGDLQRALQKLEHCDLILMDTAGRNYRNELLVSELQSLLTPMEESETYLVLSLTSKSKDMLEITEHFNKYGLDKVIFTKMDETGSLGAIFNVLRHYPLSLSYMTNGQNVPDDLLMPDDVMIQTLLLGEDRV